MCKLGDIIIIKEFKDEDGTLVSKHSFVVVNDESNSIQGLNYDFVSNMMCSFHDEEHKNKKLNYKQNVLVDRSNVHGDNINSKEGYIKANRLYYFEKSKIDYKVIAHIDDQLLSKLLKIIVSLYNEKKVELVTTNL